jgi:hypothetical protein
MARTGNRVMKQKTEKAKVYSRESRKAREIGLSTPEDYRKSAVNITERPKKKEREEQEAADAASRAKHVDRIKGDEAPLAPLKLEPKDRELSGSAGHQDVTPAVKKKATRALSERGLGMGLSRVSKSGAIQPLLGDEKKVALNDLAINDKRLVKDANKRAQLKEEKETQARADVPKSVKERRTAKRTTQAKEKIAAAKAAPVATLPEAQAKPVSKPSTGKKVDGKWVRTDGPSQMPGEGKAGILNIADIDRTAGDTSRGRRRRIERKARYNAMRALEPGASRGYQGAAKGGERTSNVLNARNEEASQKADTLAREKAARIDANKDALQKSILKRAKNMPKGTEEEKTAYKATVESGLSLIRKPAIIAKPSSTSVVETKDGKKKTVTSAEVTLRRGPKKTITTPDERDLTKSYTREVPVGAPRLGEQVSAMNYPIKMTRAGEISAQADRPKETPHGVMASHEDRLHALTKFIRVPVEGKEGGSDLEPHHLRSFLKTKAQNAGVRYNERDAVAAVFEARHKNPEMFSKISSEAIAHRTKRIGQVTEQRERGAAKAKEQRALASEGRGGKRRTPRAVRVISNVSNKFTEVNNDGSQKS